MSLRISIQIQSLRKLQRELKSKSLVYYRMKKARKLKKNWSSNDMKVLIWVICKYS